jgi:hypothetical protein
MTTIRTLDHSQIGRFGPLVRAAGSGIALAKIPFRQLRSARALFVVANPVNRRRLVIGQFIILAAAFAFAAAASSVSMLVAASFIFAASLAAVDPVYEPVPIRNRRDRRAPNP